MILPSKIDVVVVAPFPTSERVLEGWMSRINAVDSILRSKRRLYLNFSENHVRGREDVLSQKDECGWELCLSPSSTQHLDLVSEIISKVNAVYVHTIHLAEFLQPWLDSRKIIVDFHGIVPEEEAMLGRPELSAKYEKIEKAVLKEGLRCVMVSKAMEDHYLHKYPEITPRTIILPIVESLPLANRSEPSSKRSETPANVVYAGGTQTWQNIDSMLDLAKATEGFCDFTFLSHEWRLIKETATRRGSPEKTSFKFCEKNNLTSEYQKHDFGLVLRDDTPVNRVACPTKLYEYMAVGLIPIVRSPALGDFLDWNYSYITEEELKGGFFPDMLSRRMMAKRNLEIIYAMKKIFANGAKSVQMIVN